MDSRISKLGNLRVVVVADKKAVGEVAARFVATRVRRNPALALAFPTGKTPLPMYRELVMANRHGEVDFSRARVFNLDEVFGLSPLHPASYAAYLRRELLSRTNVSPWHVRLLNGLTRDPNAECSRYESAIGAEGGLDLAILGIGRNGHIAFNEPGSPLDSRTRRVELTPETIEDNDFGRLLAFGPSSAQVAGSEREVTFSPQRAQRTQSFSGIPLRPLRSLRLDRPPRTPHYVSPTAEPRSDDDTLCVGALTMGIGTILEAREVILLASGIKKAGIVARALRDAVTADVPASALQVHPRVTAILDPEAARELDLDVIPRTRLERDVTKCTKTS